jgi:hypothetical protein
MGDNMYVDVIAVFNTIKDTKPVYVVLDSQKVEITKIHTVKVKNNITELLCEYEPGDKSTMIKLYFDGLQWWID